MTPQGALALTGLVLFVLAIIFAVAASEASFRRAPRFSRAGWLTLALSATAFIGASWWQALS